MTKKQLAPLYWLWIPIVAMCIQIILEVSIDSKTLSIMHSENGLHESLQALLMIISFFVALYCTVNSKISRTLILRGWFALAALCCFYVAGEEVSWGQHIWDWATPEFWSEVNDQQETNLHNTSSWFDQKPRLLLILAIVIGTMIIPLLKKYNLLTLPAQLDELLPTKNLLVVALFVVVPQLIEKISELFDIVLFVRFSEVQELYIFYFVMLYLLTLKNKINES